MDINKKSLVSKIISKGVITPYEAIHLQHLNNQHRRQQIRNLKPSENIYQDSENLQPLVSESFLKEVVSFTQKQDGDLYDAYRSAASDLTNLEQAIGEIGYKGLALLNEIRYAREKWCLSSFMDMGPKKSFGGEDIMEYKVYSRVNQKRMTFTDILGDLGTTLSALMQAIDIILTDNYYLQNLYDPDELDCLKYLKMWIKEENYDGMTLEEKEGESVPLNLIKGCLDRGINFLFDENHPKIVGSMKDEIYSFGLRLPPSFEQGSLEYVKETVANVVETASGSQVTLSGPNPSSSVKNLSI